MAKLTMQTSCCYLHLCLDFICLTLYLIIDSCISCCYLNLSSGRCWAAKSLRQHHHICISLGCNWLPPIYIIKCTLPHTDFFLLLGLSHCALLVVSMFLPRSFGSYCLFVAFFPIYTFAFLRTNMWDSPSSLQGRHSWCGESISHQVFANLAMHGSKRNCVWYITCVIAWRKICRNDVLHLHGCLDIATDFATGSTQATWAVQYCGRMYSKFVQRV